MSSDPSIPNSAVDERFVEFLKFVKKFEREYNNMEEFKVRFDIFCDSLVKIEELNNTPGQTATFGVTHFADRTDMEKKRVCGGRKKTENKDLKTAS